MQRNYWILWFKRKKKLELKSTSVFINHLFSIFSYQLPDPLEFNELRNMNDLQIEECSPIEIKKKKTSKAKLKVKKIRILNGISVRQQIYIKKLKSQEKQFFFNSPINWYLTALIFTQWLRIFDILENFPTIIVLSS